MHVARGVVSWPVTSGCSASASTHRPAGRRSAGTDAMTTGLDIARTISTDAATTTAMTTPARIL